MLVTLAVQLNLIVTYLAAACQCSYEYVDPRHSKHIGELAGHTGYSLCFDFLVLVLKLCCRKARVPLAFLDIALM